MARILLVDDESDMRMALSNVLSRAGHEITEAGEGPAALRILEERGADLVLLDIRLPGMDGVQILRRIREKDERTPVIMVTGYGSVDSAVQVMQLGASSYLAKPFSNKELVETVERALSGKIPPIEGPLVRRLEEKVRGVPGASPAAAASAGPSPRGAARRVRVPVGFLLAAALVAAAALLWPSVSRKPRRDVGVPYAHPSALEWKGKRLWAADWFTQTVYEAELVGKELKTLRSVSLPQTHVSGLTATAEHIFLSDSWAKTIQKRRLDPRLTLEETYPSPGPRPAGLFFDGRYLWSSDTATGRIYQHELDESLTVLASYPSAGKTPVALHKDANFFWSADADTRVLYQHRLDNRLRVIAAYSLAELDEGGEPLSCIGWDGRDLWIGRDGKPVLLKRRLGDFRVRRIEGGEASR